MRKGLLQQMENQVFEWVKEHKRCIILIVLIIFILVPVLITIFAPSVSSEISADGTLGYIIQAVSAAGTISLAYITIQQNRNFKEENDHAQERLEDLAQRANELSIIGKVFDYERNKLIEIRQAGDALIRACDPEAMNQEVIGYLGRHSMKTALKIDAPLLAQRINNAFSGFCIALRCVPQYADGQNTLTESALCLSNIARKYFDTILDALTRERQENEDEESTNSNVRETLEQAITCFKSLYWKMIDEKTKEIDAIIYENKSLDEIKKMCSFFEEGGEKRQDEI